jgi:hypothetical protein
MRYSLGRRNPARERHMTTILIDAAKWTIVFGPFIGVLYCVGGFARLSLLATGSMP